MPDVIDKKFKEFLIGELAKAQSFGYVPHRLLGELKSRWAYDVACELLSNSSQSEGFDRLILEGHPELTLEALVIEHQWREYFDDAIVEIAQRRLRLSNYRAKLAPCRTDILLSIEWRNTIEFVPLNLASLKTTTEIKTVERSKMLMWEATYDVRCIEVERNAEGWAVSLQYDPTHLRNRALARDEPDLEWGVTRLAINANLSEASAKFTPFDSTEVIPGRVSFFETTLYQQLTRAQIEMLLRPGQAALRKRLLNDKDRNRCAVSNESCPEALEVAHIVDHSLGGVAGGHNAMLLRADLHGLFDCGLLSIDEKGAIRLGDVPLDSRYRVESSFWNDYLSATELKAVKAALRERERLLVEASLA